MSIIDREEEKTRRQIQKEYNDALAAAMRKNREFLKKARDVESGKIKPPPGMKTDRQIEAWKQGYLRRAAEKSHVVEKIAQEMRNAGLKVRKRIEESMGRIYADTRKNVEKLLDKVIPAGLDKMTRKQAEILLYRSGLSGSFSKIAMKNLGSDAKAVKRLRREFAQGLLKGESDAALIERIRKVTGMEMGDAMRVLRTERTHIESMAMQDTAMEHYKKTGHRSRKRWICAFRNSRETHMMMHGQTVYIDEDFTLPSGNPISYPGDSRAGAAEVCNCQCRMEIVEE